jgi:hypothetical protein
MFTIIDLRWVISEAGLISYFAWNVLVIAIMIMVHLAAVSSKCGQAFKITLT